MPTYIYVVENHLIMRTALVDFLNQRPDLHVCGATDTAQEALAQLPQTGADLALIDVSLHGMNGIELISELQIRHPAVLCLMLSAHCQPEYVQRALAAGARGYIAKGNPNEIFHAIQQVLAGEIYLSTRVRHTMSDFDKDAR